MIEIFNFDSSQRVVKLMRGLLFAMMKQVQSLVLHVVAVLFIVGTQS